jgi:hypothetical protein
LKSYKRNPKERRKTHFVRVIFSRESEIPKAGEKEKCCSKEIPEKARERAALYRFVPAQLYS